MGFLSRLFGRRKRRGTRSNPVRPHMPLRTPTSGNNPFLQQMIEASRPSRHATTPIPNNTGYVLLTNKKDHDEQYMGRNLEFDSNRGTVGSFFRGSTRGETEKVILDGQVIWEGQIRNTSVGKLRNEFFDDYDIQMLTRSQVQDILADEDDDPEMYGQTAEMDSMMEAELDELREEMEEEYVERFEEDYQRRFKQEYPEKFSADFQKHYNEWVDDELDEVVDDHEELYEEYIVTDKHIRYKR